MTSSSASYLRFKIIISLYIIKTEYHGGILALRCGSKIWFDDLQSIIKFEFACFNIF